MFKNTDKFEDFFSRLYTSYRFIGQRYELMEIYHKLKHDLPFSDDFTIKQYINICKRIEKSCGKPLYELLKELGYKLDPKTIKMKTKAKGSKKYNMKSLSIRLRKKHGITCVDSIRLHEIMNDYKDESKIAFKLIRIQKKKTKVELNNAVREKKRLKHDKYASEKRKEKSKKYFSNTKNNV